jgi:hypothetical protein
MPWTLRDCASALKQTDLRFNHDETDQVIRLVFVTSSYQNRRGEHLAVVTAAVLDLGQRVRVSIERAIEVDNDPAATCLLACRFAAAMPLVGVEYDDEFENLRLVADVPVADGSLTPLQLRTMVERLVDAAELWQALSDRNRRDGWALPGQGKLSEKVA